MSRIFLKTIDPDVRLTTNTLINASRIQFPTLDNGRLQIKTVIPPAIAAPVNVVQPEALPFDIYVGAVAVVDTGAWSGSTPITYTYQWYQTDGLADFPIVGATANTYTVTSGDLDFNLFANVSATNIGGSSNVDSIQTGIVVNPIAPVNTVAPVISGTAAPGETLTLTSVGTWTGLPTPAYTYQWQTNGANIATATGTTLIIEGGIENTNITCVVKGTNIAGESAATSNIITTGNTLPVNTVLPVISGTITEDETLSVTDGTWTGTPSPTFAYQWRRDTGSGFNNIGSATNNTYTLVTADVGADINCVVTATNIVGSVNATANEVGPIASAAILPANTVAPAVSGFVAVGQTLTSTTGTWTGTPTPTYSYQWKSDGSNISGATSSTYVVQTGTVATTIRCDVTATNLAGAVTQASNNIESPLKTILADSRLVEIRTARGNSDVYFGLDATSNGQPVGSWTGHKGLAATQSTTGAKPTRIAGGVDFDGTDDWLEVSSTEEAEFAAVGWTVLVCLRDNPTPSTNRIIWGAARIAAPLNIVNIDSAGNMAKAIAGAGSVIFNYPNWLNSPSVIWTALEDIGTNQLRVKSSNGSQSFTLGTYPTGMDRVAIGCRPISVPVLFHDGAISCFAVFSEALSFAEMTAYEAILTTAGVI